MSRREKPRNKKVSYLAMKQSERLKPRGRESGSYRATP
ncbi:unnamed protein product [Ectocarpus sp. 8 AP-2014]